MSDPDNCSCNPILELLGQLEKKIEVMGEERNIYRHTIIFPQWEEVHRQGLALVASGKASQDPRQHWRGRDITRGSRAPAATGENQGCSPLQAR